MNIFNILKGPQQNLIFQVTSLIATLIKNSLKLSINNLPSLKVLLAAHKTKYQPSFHMASVFLIRP
jgi:hypothetical protein